MSRTIAIVEDEAAIRDNFAAALSRLGYRVLALESRREAERVFARELPDLVLIDVGLRDEPEGGFELCRWLRARSATLPIMFVSARDSDPDVISGLRLGADDYLSKDASLAQLAARVSGLLRRVEALRRSAAEEGRIEHGPLRLEPERMRITWRGVEVPLTVTEFWMVHALLRVPGAVRSREQLAEEAHVEADQAAITSHVKRIRRKFQAVDPGFDAIETVHGAGYRWRLGDAGQRAG
ncbi:MAG: response regulator [Xanthomonadales bacterium]|nr:response regulator [Xanthomonadales bacterium]